MGFSSSSSGCNVAPMVEVHGLAASCKWSEQQVAALFLELLYSFQWQEEIHLCSYMESELN
jgi:hypothetical protein